MRNHDFLYFLLDDEGRPLIGNELTGSVSIGDINNLEGTFLKFTPDKWMDILVKFARNKKYWGLFRDYTVPLIFVKDGRLIVADTFWRKGIEGYTKLAILKADRRLFPIKHKTWYTGEIDYSTLKQDKTGVTVNVMEGGLAGF